MYNNDGLQNAVQQAMMHNSGQQQNRNQMGMQQAFQQQHWNPNMQYRPDPLKQNPQAFAQEASNPYYTVFPDPSRYAPQISQGQYNAMMQQDYGQNPNVNAPGLQQAASPQQYDTGWLDEKMYINPNYAPLHMKIGKTKQFNNEWLPMRTNPFTGTEMGRALYGYEGMSFGDYLKKEMPWVNPATLSPESPLALQRKMQRDYTSSMQESSQSRYETMRNRQEQGG
jgi:hypothetical protein